MGIATLSYSIILIRFVYIIPALRSFKERGKEIKRGAKLLLNTPGLPDCRWLTILV
jgi:hypothetical protein